VSDPTAKIEIRDSATLQEAKANRISKDLIIGGETDSPDYSQYNFAVINFQKELRASSQVEKSQWPTDNFEAEIEGHIESYGESIPQELLGELHEEARFWKGREEVTPQDVKGRVDEIKQLQDLAYKDHRSFHGENNVYGRGYHERHLGDWIGDAISESDSIEEVERKLSCIARINGDLNGLFALNKFGVGNEGEKGDAGLKILFDTLGKGESVQWLRSLGVEVLVAGEGGDESGIYLKGDIPLNSKVPDYKGEGEPPTIIEEFIQRARSEVESQDVSSFLDYENADNNPEKIKLQEIMNRSEEIVRQRKQDGDTSLEGYSPNFRLSTSFGAVIASEAFHTVRFDLSTPYANNQTLRNEMFHLADVRAQQNKEEFKAALKNKDPFLWLLYSKGDIEALRGQVQGLQSEVADLKAQVLALDPLKKADIDRLMEASVEDALGQSPSVIEPPKIDAEGRSFEDKVKQIQELEGYADMPGGPFSNKLIYHGEPSQSTDRINEILRFLPEDLGSGVLKYVDFCRGKGLAIEEIVERVEARKEFIDRAYKDPRPRIPGLFRGDIAKLKLKDQVKDMLREGRFDPNSFDKIMVSSLYLTGMKLINDTGTHDMGDIALEEGAYSQKEGFPVNILNAEGIYTDAYTERGDQFWQVIDARNDIDPRDYPDLIKHIELEGFMAATEAVNAGDLLDWNNPEVKRFAAALGIEINTDEPFRLSMIPGTSSIKHAIMSLDVNSFNTIDEYTAAVANETFRAAQANAEFVKRELIKQTVRKSNPQAYLGVARSEMEAFENERTMLFDHKDQLREMLRTLQIENSDVTITPETAKLLYEYGLERDSRKVHRDSSKSE
jgi:hypothetical protein